MSIIFNLTFDNINKEPFNNEEFIYNVYHKY